MNKPIFGQNIFINIFKQNCTDGYSKLAVEVRENGVLLDSARRKFYDYSNINMLHDSIKMRIIDSLFQYVSDTSNCCNSVQSYEIIDYPGCYIVSPTSKYFSIEIEALFIINRVAYNTATFRIGCYPVLFDSEKKQEINNNNCLINLMVEHYRKWFKMYKETGKRPDYRFLNEGRIRWW